MCKLTLLSQKKEKIALTLLIAALLLSGIATANAGSGVTIDNPSESMPVYKVPGGTVKVIFRFLADAPNELATITVFKGATVIGLTTHELKDLEPFQPYTFYVDVFLANQASDGLYDVEVKVASQPGGPIGTAVEFKAVIIDTKKPVISTPSPVGWVNDADQTISATITDADPSSGIKVDSIVMKLDDVPVVGHDYDPGTGVVSYDAMGLGEGPHSVTVDVSDNAGNSATQLVWSFSVDLTKPVISTPSPVGWTSVEKPTLSAVISDADSGIKVDSIVMKLDDVPVVGHDYNAMTGNVSFTAVNELVDGTDHKVTVDVSDNAGNEATLLWSFTVDLEPPEVTINAVTTPTKEVVQTITGTYVEKDLVDIFVNGVEAQIDEPKLEWTAVDVPLPLDGPNKITAVATALSGNTGKAETTIFRDTATPVISSPSPEDGAWVKVADQTISATITDADPSSGIKVDSIVMKLDDVPVVGHVYDPGTGVVSYDAMGLGEGEHSVTVDVKDKAGNPATQLVWSFSVDLTDPVVTIYGVNTPTKVATQTMVGTYLEDHFRDIVVGGVVADIDKPGPGEWTAYDVPLPLEGLNTITAVATDLAGNTGEASTEIFRDTEAPEISTPSPVGWVSVADLTISAVISDADPSSGIDLTTILMKLDSVPVGLYDPATGVVSFGATGLIEGTHSVTVDVSDLACNTAYEQWSFSVDLNPPEVTIDPVKTPTNDVMQKITGTYTEANLDTIIVGGVSATIDHAGEGTFSALVSLEEGSNTIEAVATDLAGNTGTDSTDIFLDSEIPTITPLTPEPDSFTKDKTPLISAGLYDATSGIDVDTVVMTVDDIVVISTPKIDGVLSPDEWGQPLCTKTEYGESVTVYVHARMDAIYLAFDSTDNLDERAIVDTGSGANDVLDWNIGLVGSDMTKAPWRYTLHTKAQSDTSWGGSFSTIDDDGTGKMYRGTWGDIYSDPPYSSIPAGLEMVTSFATGHRVTEFKIPMSLMFDGTHGWDSPNAGDVLLLGGTIQAEPDAWPNPSSWDAGHLFWPEGIDHGVEDTFAVVTLSDIVITDTFVSYTPGQNLGDGPHYVTVDVSDNAGNTATRTWFFNIDLTNPIVTIDGVDTPTNVAKQTITGTYTEDNLDKIVIGTVEADFDDGIWSAEVGLNEGLNKIMVVATDLAGNTGEASTEIFLDTVAPVISDPKPDAWANVANPTISAEISDADSGIDETTIVMTLDGTKVDHVYDDGTGVVSYTQTLGEGTYSVMVDVSDNVGNPATRTWVFNVDLTDPVVTIDGVDTPTNKFVQMITGTYVEANIDTIVVRGVEATAENGLWKAVDVPLLSEGSNEIIAVATDKAGNEGTDSADIFRDTVAPTVPDLNATSKPLRIELDWSNASDPDYPWNGSGVAYYNIYRIPYFLLGSVYAPDTEYIDEDFNPEADEGVIYYYAVTAVDNAGNEGDFSEIANATYFKEIRAFQYEIDLWPTWNLISLPLIPESPVIEAVLDSVIDDVDIVWSYDPTAASKDQWTFYQSGEGDLDKMVDGKGYWIYMKDWATLSGKGYEMIPATLPPEYLIYEGWNLIGFKTYDYYPEDGLITEADCLLGKMYLDSYFAEHYGSLWQMLDQAASIWNLVPHKGFISYDADVAGFVFMPLEGPMMPGEGYWLYVTKEGTIAPPLTRER